MFMDSWKTEFEDSALGVIRDMQLPHDMREGVALGLIDHFAEEGKRGFDFNLKCAKGRIPFMMESAREYADEKAAGYMKDADVDLLRRLVTDADTPSRVREAAARSLLEMNASPKDTELVRKHSEFVKKKPGKTRRPLRTALAH